MQMPVDRGSCSFDPSAFAKCLHCLAAAQKPTFQPIVLMGMFKLQSIAKYDRSEGIEFSVPCPAKVSRGHEALSALFGPEVQIDRKKYKILNFCVLPSSAPIKQGESIGVLVTNLPS